MPPSFGMSELDSDSERADSMAPNAPRSRFLNGHIGEARSLRLERPDHCQFSARATGHFLRDVACR